MHRILVLLVILAAFSSAASADEGKWTLASPDGKLSVTLLLTAPVGDTPFPADRARLYYRVERLSGGKPVEIVGLSPLGIVRDDAAFVDGLTPAGPSEPTTIDETYRLVHGKRGDCRATARQQVFPFRNPQGAAVEIVVRVADDGVALRYRFPGEGGPHAVTEELTGFHIPAGRAWMMPYDRPSTYTPAYELYYDEVATGSASADPYGWAMPALFELTAAKHWVLLAEAATDGTYCAARLAQNAAGGVYRIRFPDPGDGNGQGDVAPRGTLPWATPWRVLLIGDRLGTVVESSLITDLNPPSRVDDTAWIQPGRVAWSWWSDHDSPRDFQKQKAFVDLAAEMNWEYCLVDANWDLMDGGNVRELARYAKEKGVGLLLWYNSGGDHNVVTERPRGTMNLEPVRKFEFDMLHRWGVAGVKVDFFQSDKQNVVGLYHDILRSAAEAHVMVNFHGCTAPKGWERTWPNLMSMEAVRGEENYGFSAEYPARAPRFNAILPFTRNAVGPMDYTPVGLTDDRYPHLTSNAHELALTVVFQSGWLHFADRVSAYRDLAPAPKEFLRRVPTAWDETRLLDGRPGEQVVIARRKGAEWYLGAINGREEAIQVSVPLAMLGSGAYRAVLIGDGADPRSFGVKEFDASGDGTLKLAMQARGGAVIHFVPR